MKLKILAFSRLLLATISLIWMMLSNLSLGWTVCLTYEFSLLSFSRVSILLVMLYFLPLLLSTLVLFAKYLKSSSFRCLSKILTDASTIYLV